ncbi:MAG: hypothetical protein U0165_05995 [Polyangiaceae bacterium]
MRASEPEAFAAEVRPEELAGMPVLFALGCVEVWRASICGKFDFGGGTLDIACGRFRPSNETEQRRAEA